MGRKQIVIEQFQDVLQNYPLAYLLFGSVGRGCYQQNLDIDSLIVFRDKDIDFFLSNAFIKLLPFDSLPNNLIDDTDRNDLANRRIDFLRIKGVTKGENVEFQLFPLCAVKKIGELNHTVLTVGIKRFDNDYRISDPIQRRQTIDFNGRRVFYEKRPRLAQGGQRIDFSEIATHYQDSRLICGVSTKKFLTSKVLIDKISLIDFLDNHILRQIIIFLNIEKLETIDYRILFTLFTSKQQKFGTIEEKLLSERFDKQICLIKG